MLIKTAAGAALAAPALRRSVAQQPTTVRWWYHFDNPANTPAELVDKFQKANPGIRIEAESIPWGGGNDYQTRLFAAVVAGSPPDCALVKVANQSRLLEMGALAPLDQKLAGWAGRADIPEDAWTLNRGPDGKQYYLPAHYVVLYLYYRVDWFKDAGLQPPKTFEDFLAAAKALTKEADQRWGFGMRGGAGGHDNWGPFVLGNGAKFEKGGMVSPQALAANRWFVDLYRTHHVFPPSAPNDGFRQIVDNFKAGRTAMAIHHIGSSNEVSEALGDKASAVPVPKPANGKGWTLFCDESNAIFAGSKVQDAAFKWITFLSTAENNLILTKLSGQLTITRSGGQNWKLHPQRFVDATFASLASAAVLPDNPKTPDFVRTVWPTNMQRALLGEIQPDAMMQAIEKHFNG
ncbi:MAG: sugar ABC transporter substrate-binding protein [Proteobacteria bacterium]|nr:sugar ABC transporter substrate-binding protein [Pseudomonadota bacterium]